MAIIAQDTKQYTPAPEGITQAVCVDVADLGVVETSFGKKRMVKLVWQLPDVDSETGKRFTVQRRYGLSLNEKASLRKDLEAWRGKKFTKEELQGFDLERLLGVNAQLQVLHNVTDDGKTYANVAAILPLGKGMTAITGQDYTRIKDRDQTQQQAASPAGSDGGEDLPF